MHSILTDRAGWSRWVADCRMSPLNPAAGITGTSIRQQMAGASCCYQEWGKDPIEMNPGDSIVIPANVKHWHGAAPDSCFSHLAMELPGTATGTIWEEPVDPADYETLK